MIRRTAGNATSFGTPKAKSFVQAKAHRDRPLSEAERARNRMKPKVRVKVEHAFLVVAGGDASFRVPGLTVTPIWKLPWKSAVKVGDTAVDWSVLPYYLPVWN